MSCISEGRPCGHGHPAVTQHVALELLFKEQTSLNFQEGWRGVSLWDTLPGGTAWAEPRVLRTSCKASQQQPGGECRPSAPLGRELEL